MGDTLANLSQLASLLGALEGANSCRTGEGRLQEAESLCHRALNGYEMQLGSSHPDTLASLSVLESLVQQRLERPKVCECFQVKEADANGAAAEQVLEKGKRGPSRGRQAKLSRTGGGCWCAVLYRVACCGA